MIRSASQCWPAGTPIERHFPSPLATTATRISVLHAGRRVASDKRPNDKSIDVQATRAPASP
jgi:hypothetical protein